MTQKLKVYELAKELSVDPQTLVEVVQRLGVDVKNTMSILGTEEVRSVRDYYKKNRMPAKSAAPAPTTTKPSVTEKRVGATVIRRRAVAKAEEPASPMPIEVKVPVIEEIVPEQVLAVEEAPAPVVVKEEAPPIVEVPPVPVEPKIMKSAKREVEPPPPPTRQRRAFPSIIKKTTTEAHLVETVGPKVERPKREEFPAAPAARKSTTTTGDSTTVTAGGIKTRVKEVELVATDPNKEAGRRRLLDRQNTVFKSADYLKRELVHSTKKKKATPSRPAMKTQITTPAEHKRVVEMGENISVADLAKAMGVKAAMLIGKLMGMGVTATMNQSIDHDTASLVGQEFGFEVKQKVFKEEEFVPQVDLAPEKMTSRAPVVTIMGHVDHGKTSLLDAIRKTNVAAGEAGGITQHIGAYTVKVAKGKVTFLDTPGHEAFTAMRARGAKVTDLVILVVSATDGVMPQTLESVAHAKAAKVPLIVAVNKTDLPDANPDRIKQTLAGHDLNPEEWGGDTIYVNVSAKTGKGIDKLLESILLQAEMLELKANQDTQARGTIVECKLDKFRGPIATVLVQQGTLKVGDIAVVGTTYGKIKAMANSLGAKVTEALPSDPVEVLGLSDVPNVGDDFYVVSDDKTARELMEGRVQKQKAASIEASRPKLTLDEMLAGANSEEKELRLILKADVQGSAEALKEALLKFPTDKAKLKLLHVGTGGITESDVMLANASRAAIVGFNVRPELKAHRMAEQEGVTVRSYTIIYDLLEDAKKMLEGLLDTTIKEKVIGRAEVRSVFNIPKIGAVAGSAVLDGKVVRGCFLRLLRDNRVVYEGKISSLRRFKDDVKEVGQGFECGIGLENFNDLKMGDQFEAFLKEEQKGVL